MAPGSWGPVNERERFHLLFRGEAVDRPPLLEEGVRDTVVERWHEQGLPRSTTHLEMFGLTPHENIGPDITFDARFSGRVLDLSDRDYRRAFDVSPRRFPDDWSDTVKRLEDRDHIVCIWASRGFFQALGVGDWPTLERALMGTKERPEWIRSRIEMYGEFCARMLDKTLQEVEPDFIYMSEPISDNDAPLISPVAFTEIMIPAYERIINVARLHGCENILVSTYGNSASLFPAMIDAGVTMLWISEAAEVPELDYRALRYRFGPLLGLIGGIPLSILRTESPGSMRERIETMVPPLLESGRYIPLAGGRVRDGISWEVYKKYRELIAEMVAKR